MLRTKHRTNDLHYPHMHRADVGHCPLMSWVHTCLLSLQMSSQLHHTPARRGGARWLFFGATSFCDPQRRSPQGESHTSAVLSKGWIVPALRLANVCRLQVESGGSDFDCKNPICMSSAVNFFCRPPRRSQTKQGPCRAASALFARTGVCVLY